MAKEQKSLTDKLTDSRIIVISGYIDSDKASKIIFQLLSYKNDNEKEDIQLFIGSEGGNYLDMLAIYDTLKSLPNPIAGTCIGVACGYSVLLLASCDKGKRYALRHSRISFEQPYGVLQAGVNQQTEIAIEAKEVAREREIFETLLAEETKQKLSVIHRDCEAGMELDAIQAVEYGIIDEIIE